MKQTGDEEIDIVLKNVAPAARDLIRAGQGVDVETCLDKAIVLSLKEYLWTEKSLASSQSAGKSRSMNAI